MVDVLVPCVGGVGEITKAVSKGKKAIDAVDDVHDAAKVVDNVIDGVKIQKATNFTADAKKAVKALDHSGGVTRSTAAAGRKIHSGYRFGKHGKEYSQVPGFRMDYLDEKNKVIYELKPNNPQSIAKGIKQLKRYNEALGGGYKLILELY